MMMNKRNKTDSSHIFCMFKQAHKINLKTTSPKQIQEIYHLNHLYLEERIMKTNCYEVLLSEIRNIIKPCDQVHVTV